MQISEKSITIIRNHLSKIDVELPLKSIEDIDRIVEYFSEIEVSLSNGLCSGKQIDNELLSNAELVVTDLTASDDTDLTDLEAINKCLMN